MESDSERNPEMELKAPGFDFSIELDDSKSFEHATQVLEILRQKEHGDSLDLDTGDGPEISEEEIRSTIEESLDEIRESIEKLGDRTSDLEDQVDSIRPVEEVDTVDQDRIENLEETFEQLAEKMEGLEESVAELQEQPEPESKEPDEETTGPETRERESQAEEEEGSAEDGLECPQCGEEYDSPRALSTHTSRSGDHVEIAEYFRNVEDELECSECGHTSDNSDAISVHFSEQHDTGMVQYYVDHFDELDVSEEPDPEPEQAVPEDEETEEQDVTGEEDEDEEREFDADTIPDLIDQQIVEPDPPYSYDRFKQLDKIEQAAALYLAGKKIRKGDAADYADKLLTTDVNSTSDKEAQYIYRLITVDMSQYFQEKATENSFGREKIVYRLEDALPSGVEELQVQEWTTEELEDLPEAAVSEIVLETLNEIGPATLEEVQDYIYADGEESNHKIKRVLENYLDDMLSVQWEDGKKQYRLKSEIEERLEKDFLSLYQAMEKKVSGSSQYICEDCGEVLDASNEAKEHRREYNHLNWDKRNHLPWRDKAQRVRARA